MQLLAIGRMLRIIRIRRRLRQADVAVQGRIATSTVARHERGVVGSLRALERHAEILDLRLELRLVGRSGQASVADEEHAAIVTSLETWFRSEGQVVELEASFSEFGERGRIDLLAYHPATGVLVMIEVKTLLADLQDLLGVLNVRRRLAPTIARRRGWSAARIVSILAVAATPLNRSTVARHAPLFADFAVRRLSAASIASTDQFLVWVTPQRASRSAWINGRQRVRVPRRRAEEMA